MKNSFRLISLSAVLLASCASAAYRTVVFTFENKSEHRLNWVSIQGAKIDPIGGVLSPGVFKTTVDQVWRYDPSAIVTFIDFETREPYRVPISFEEVNTRIRAGQCRRVVVTIFDYDRATVHCE